MKSLVYKLIVLSLLFIFQLHDIQALEIIGKTFKCDASKFPSRGYPFFFYFENKKKFHSFYILKKKIKYHNFDYKQINENIYDLSHIGFFDINNLTLTHSKYNTKCLCNILNTKKEINLILRSYIDNEK